MEPGRGAHRAVKLLATRSWNDIDGLWMQVGCYTANAMQLEAGRKPGQLLPCAGEGSNGGRVQMLPAGTAADGATGSYAPMGAPRLRLATVLGRAGAEAGGAGAGRQDVPKRVTLPLPLVTNDTIKLCQEGSWAEMKAGCNAFKPSVVQNRAGSRRSFRPTRRKSG